MDNQYFKKVEIKTEADLPKEDGCYIVKCKDTDYVENAYFSKNTTIAWINEFESYLQPIPEPEKVSDLSDEVIEKQFPVGGEGTPNEYNRKFNKFRRQGAMWARDRKPIVNASIPTREMPTITFEELIKILEVDFEWSNLENLTSMQKGLLIDTINAIKSRTSVSIRDMSSDGDTYDKISCLTGYLEMWLNDMQVPHELDQVINESNDWLKSRTLSSENKPQIITICGSGRFLKEMHEVEERLTLEGKIVLMIGVNTKDVARTKELEHHKPMLDELHLRKIDLSDSVFVVNKDGYIGESTKREIEYAQKIGKPIQYLSEEEK